MLFFLGLSLILTAMGCSPAVLIEAPPTGGTGGDGGDGGAGGAAGGGGSVPVSCDGAMTLAEQQDLAHDIALDDTHVYWTTDGLTTSVERTPKCGGPIETLYEGEDFVDLAGMLAVDETKVYWTGGLGNGDWGVRSVPKTGGAITTVAKGFDTVNGIAIDTEYVYFFSSCGNDECLQRVSKTGGVVTTLAAGLQYTLNLTVDATHVYWIAYPLGYGRLMRVLKTGGPAELLTEMQEKPESLAVDDQLVYVAASKNSVDIHIVRVPLGGAPVPTVLVSGVHGTPGDIAVDDTNVYYAVGPALDGPRAIFEVPKTGGTPVSLTPTQSWPFALAIDETGAYFTNDTWQGTVKRAPK